jgi:hypothetical protein
MAGSTEAARRTGIQAAAVATRMTPNAEMAVTDLCNDQLSCEMSDCHHIASGTGNAVSWRRVPVPAAESSLPTLLLLGS